MYMFVLKPHQECHIDIICKTDDNFVKKTFTVNLITNCQTKNSNSNTVSNVEKLEINMKLSARLTQECFCNSSSSQDD